MSYKLLTNLLFEPRGKHNPSLTYNIKDTVMSEDGSKVYFALDNVPAGIPITDTNYWMLQMDLSASKNAMDVAAANARTQTDATISSANTRVEDMMGKAAEAVTSVADYATKVGMRVKGETKITKGNPMTIYPDGGSLLKVQTDIPIKQLGEGDPYPAGSGKNKFTGWIRGGKISSVTGVFESTSDAARTGYIPVMPSKQIEISGLTDTLYHFVVYYDKEKNFISRSGAVDHNAVTIRTPDNCAYIAITQYENVNVTGTIADLKDTVQIEYGVSTTEYEHWENIRPFVGYDKLNLGAAGKNLCNPDEFTQGDLSEGRYLTNSVDTNNVSGYVPVSPNTTYTRSSNCVSGSREIALYDANKIFLSRTFGETFTTPSNCYFVRLEWESTYPLTESWFQLEIGSTPSAYAPYQGNDLHTVQLDKTTYQGHYDWLTGKFRAEWGLYAVTGTEDLRLLPDNPGTCNRFCIDLPETLTNSTEMKCSHFKQGVGEEWAYSDADVDSYFGEYCITSGYIRVLLPAKTRSEAQAYLAAKYAAGTPVQFVWKLATPIEIQLAPNVITALEDGGMNYIYGDADLTVEWVKALEASLTEHGNAKVDANNEALLMDVAQKERSVGNPVVINDAVANVAFPHVETVFMPKQSGSGDPYPGGGGKNLCSIGSKTLTYYEPLENESVIPAGTYTFSAVVSSNDTDFDECYVAFFDTYLGNTVGALWVKRSVDNDRVSGVVTLTADAKWIYLYASWNAAYGEGDTATFKDIQIEAGSTATPYAPYANIRPITGYDKLDLGATGKNLFNLNQTYDYFVDSIITGDVITTTFSSNGSLHIKEGDIHPAGAYTLTIVPVSGFENFVAWLYYADNDEEKEIFRFNSTKLSAAFIADRPFKIGFSGIYGNPDNVCSYKVQLEVGSDSTAYEPYQGTLHTIQLCETVYGGRYNWLTGKLVAEWSSVALRDLTMSYKGGDHKYFEINMPTDALATADFLCESYKNVGVLYYSSMPTTPTGCMGYYPQDRVWRLKDTRYTSVNELFSGNGDMKIAYKLATPIEIQLDPTRITTIPGTNTIFGDGEFTIDWFKSYKKVAEERENLLLDSFTDKAELTGNPIVMTPVGGIPFDSVVTEFAPKQAGSGDPYPAGGGKNLFDAAACTPNAVLSDRTITISGEIVSIKSNALTYPQAAILTFDPITLSAGTYTFVLSNSVPVVVRVNNVLVVNPGNLYETKTFSEAVTIDHIAIEGTEGQVLNASFSICIRADNVAEYVTYSNIRPFIGYDKLSLGAAGKNIFPAWAESSYTMNGVTFTKQADGSIRAHGTPTAYANIQLTTYKTLKEHGFAEGVYVFSGLPEASNAWFVDLIGDANTQNINFYQNGSFNLSAEVKENGTYAWRIVITPNMGAVDLIFKPQVEFGYTATPYVPYTNTLHTVQIGQTVYGGKFDWLTGKLTDGIPPIEFDGDEVVSTDGDGSGIFTTYALGTATEAYCENLCSHYTSVRDYESFMATDMSVCVWASGQIRIHDSRFNSVSEINAYYAAQKAAGTPVQIAYKLATPVEIQLTPTEIIALPGTNTLYGDGNTITAKFRQSKDVDILKRLSALETLMINQTKGE